MGLIPGSVKSPGEGNGCPLQYSWLELILPTSPIHLLQFRPELRLQLWPASWEQGIERALAAHPLLTSHIPLSKSFTLPRVSERNEQGLPQLQGSPTPWWFGRASSVSIHLAAKLVPCFSWSRTVFTRSVQGVRLSSGLYLELGKGWHCRFSGPHVTFLCLLCLLWLLATVNHGCCDCSSWYRLQSRCLGNEL